MNIGFSRHAVYFSSQKRSSKPVLGSNTPPEIHTPASIRSTGSYEDLAAENKDIAQRGSAIGLLPQSEEDILINNTEKLAERGNSYKTLAQSLLDKYTALKEHKIAQSSPQNSIHFAEVTQLKKLLKKLERDLATKTEEAQILHDREALRAKRGTTPFRPSILGTSPVLKP